MPTVPVPPIQPRLNPFADAPVGKQYGNNSVLGLEDVGDPGLSLTDQYYLAGLGATQFGKDDPEAQRNFDRWDQAMKQYRTPSGGWMPEATQARQQGNWKMPSFGAGQSGLRDIFKGSAGWRDMSREQRQAIKNPYQQAGRWGAAAEPAAPSTPSGLNQMAFW